MKYICLLILIIVFGCQKKKNFVLNGTVYGDAPNYIYLNYGEEKDSALVINNKFQFKGKVNNPLLADLSIRPTSTIENPFYIENSNMNIEITVENKKYKELEVHFIKVDTLIGTTTLSIQNDFENFRRNHSNDINWNTKVYNKLTILIEQNPTNAYAGDLLAEISEISILEKKQINALYKKLHLKSQSSYSMASIRRIISPKPKVGIGNSIADFELPNQNNTIISTKKFKGSVLLIDFWASWCIPCRKQNIELTKVYKLFKDDRFNVLGVSVDSDKKKWLKALKDDYLLWDNVIDINGFDGEISEIYDLSYSIPHNFLINKEGEIIAKDLNMEDLKEILEKLKN